MNTFASLIFGLFLFLLFGTSTSGLKCYVCLQASNDFPHHPYDCGHREINPKWLLDVENLNSFFRIPALNIKSYDKTVISNETITACARIKVRIQNVHGTQTNFVGRIAVNISAAHSLVHNACTSSYVDELIGEPLFTMIEPYIKRQQVCFCETDGCNSSSSLHPCFIIFFICLLAHFSIK